MSPVDAELVAQRALTDQAIALYQDLLAEAVAEHRQDLADHPQTDREEIISLLVRDLMQSKLCRMNMANLIGVAIDLLARQEDS